MSNLIEIDQTICKAAIQVHSHPYLSYICIYHCAGFQEAHSYLKNVRRHELCWFVGRNQMTNVNWMVNLIPSFYVKVVFHWRVFKKLVHFWRYWV